LQKQIVIFAKYGENTVIFGGKKIKYILFTPGAMVYVFSSRL
jgi:hypothetical protein